MNDGLLETYKKADRKYRLKQSKIGCVLVVLLIPAGLSLDFFVYPELLAELTAGRFTAAFFVMVVLLFHYRKDAEKYTDVLTFTWLSITLFMLCYMIYITEGANSSYYAGISLLIIAIGILLPLTMRELLLFCVLTYASYLLSCYMRIDYQIDGKIFFNNLYFLTLASIISLTAVYFGSKRRKKEFYLHIELDERNKRLKELDKLKSNFFANVSHELRTPLTLVLSPVKDLLANENSLNSNTKRMLTLVNNNAVRLLKLVNDLLDIVRLEEDGFDLERGKIELNEFIRGVTQAFEHQATSKGIRIDMQLTDQALIICVDHGALEKIIINLLANAVKFTNTNGVITVKTFQRGDNAVFEIVDNGIGIHQDDLPYIFDRFRQADGSTTRKYTGTGLGLALVKELVEKQDGNVEVLSEIGQGTSMMVAFPCVQHGEIIKVERQVTSPLYSNFEEYSVYEVQETHDDYGDNNLPTLLIVDDEPDIQSYLKTLLQSDFNITLAKDGKEALNLVYKINPDIVLLDLMIPEIDGLQVCKQIKENEHQLTTKVLLLTARVDEEAKIEALNFGADDFLTKPFSSMEVKTRLANLHQTTALQRELALRNEELVKAVDELSSTQAKLVQSEKLNALGKMSAGLLHEINNPLNYSMTALQLAAKDPVIRNNEDLFDMCSDALEGMERISAIVGDLRSFVSPHDLSMQEAFSLHNVIDKSLRFMANDLKDIRVILESCEDINVIGSENHINQVLINLLSNAVSAIKSSPRHGQGVITLNFEVRKERVYISLVDNGCGIERDSIKNIFDPFFTMKGVGEGMGLGLSICHAIIKSHGGEVVVKSELGNGACFMFDLQREGKENK